tara:strand:- start:91 stop:363 length:273 start_codon:yes stop_codon:yes gene_type:complete
LNGAAKRAQQVSPKQAGVLLYSLYSSECFCENERDDDEVDVDGDDFRDDGSKTKFLENCGSDAFYSPTKEENDKDDDESQSCEERRRRRE